MVYIRMTNGVHRNFPSNSSTRVSSQSMYRNLHFFRVKSSTCLSYIPKRLDHNAVQLQASARATHDTPIQNEVGIQMLSRCFQRVLFGCELTEYPRAPENVLAELRKHGINLDIPLSTNHSPVNFPLPEIRGSNIADHMASISNELLEPYNSLLQTFKACAPKLPSVWSTCTGWTRYKGDTSQTCRAPLEDALVFDTEVLMEAGSMPTLAVAMSSEAWYSWVSPTLFDDSTSNRSTSTEPDLLISLYPTEDMSGKKCIIGHFVSYDRARLKEEYQPYGTGTRFVDTLSLHVAVSGLTSTQRHLKTTALKNNFNNKLWKTYMRDHGEKESLDSLNDGAEKLACMDLQWISETSLNKLTDVYQLYCAKTPLQDKQARSVFESGTKREVQSQFQDLMRYCATDVLMTFEVFQNLFPLYQERFIILIVRHLRRQIRYRFPHSASLLGLLEMGSMYLPINNTWNTFQERAQTAFAENEMRQKRLLMQLAEKALQRYSDPANNSQEDPWLWDLDWTKPKIASKKTDADRRFGTLPKWYRELIPKPIKSNLDSGPALVTAQMRIAPKLLRLCWKGLPLHYDQVLKWGVLIPGRAPQPYGDPRFYTDATTQDDQNSQDKAFPSGLSSGHYLDSIDLPYRVLSNIPVVKTTAAGTVDYQFPYKSYLIYWLEAMRGQLWADVLDTTITNSDSRPGMATSYSERTSPGEQDDLLLAEFQRSVQAMPLEANARKRLSATIRAIRTMGVSVEEKMSRKEQWMIPKQLLPHENLGEMQARGPAFWLDVNRHRIGSNDSSHIVPSTLNGGRGQRKNRRQAVDTVNPIIPTCWFNHLPHENGEGHPVGSPLSRSFQVHIATNRLHSAYAPDQGSPSSNEHTEPDSAGLANQLLQDRVHASFWQSYSKRIKNHQYNPNERYGAILPQVIASGTVSRRAVEPLWLTASNADKNRLGSEIKAMVQALPGLCFVGADVDSQEMWIASLIGDASVGFQGATPYGWMTLEGNKTDGTDLHTKIAQIMGITRNEAKILNYARLYGSGFEFTKHLLTKFSNITPEQASLKARELIRTTKGNRNGGNMPKLAWSNEGIQDRGKVENGGAGHSRWHGGTESAVFNELEYIARSSEPRTPFLGAQLTRALNPKLVKEDFLPSRINWVVQSSAVDYLHCMLVVMRWLIELHRLPVRLCISIHDEVRYMCREDVAPQVAMALQISNLLTRAFFAYQVGMRDLPESVAFFSSVEIDSCLRKTPTDDCITPSNPDGLSKSYNIRAGQSMTIHEIIDKTDGHIGNT